MFTKFENTNKRQETRITMTGHSSFGFPTKYYKDNNIKNYKFVTLYFDEDERKVGLHFHNNEEEKHKFTIIKSKDGFGGSIIATSFFKDKSLDPKKNRGRYEWEKVNLPEIGDVFAIKLNNLDSETAPSVAAAPEEPLAQ